MKNGLKKIAEALGPNNGGRHPGREGWRYVILGPQESGKTTLLIRIVKDWEADNKELPVFSNIRIFDLGPEGQSILDPRVTIYRDPFKQWAKYRKGLLVCDQMATYLNSLQGYTEPKIMKTLLELASNLSKQDLEIVATEQASRGIHKRFRINFNRFYSPTMDENFRISYYAYNNLEDYEEKNIEHAKGPFRFNARDYWAYFDTKEIVMPKVFNFKPENELSKMEKWFEKKGIEFLPKHANDALAFYQTKQHLEWTMKQEKAVKYQIALKYQNEEE